MGRSEENAPFVCAHCSRHVQPLTNGSYRNHCPQCLWSVHVDCKPGDRANRCRGLMEPVGVRASMGSLQLVLRCTRCGAVRINRAALNTTQPDEFSLLIELASARPLSSRGSGQSGYHSP